MIPSLDPASNQSPVTLVTGLEVSEDALRLAHTARNLNELLRVLMRERLHVDAVRILLRVLPKRYALAWTCECFKRDAERAALSPADAACLAAAEHWVADGGDAAREAALEHAEAGKFETAGSWVAAAAAFSGGSLAPPGYAVVPPKEFLTADACFAALCLLAAREPRQFGPRLAGWLERALGVFAPGAGVSPS
jgi:hypothetical protein